MLYYPHNIYYLECFTVLEKLNLTKHRQYLLFIAVVLLKFLLVRSLLFENNSVVHTIFVETGYLLFIFGVIELLPIQKVKNFLYITANLIISILLLIVLVYHDYFGYIVTIHAFTQLGQVGTIKDSVLQLIHPIYLILFVDFIIISIYPLIRKKVAISRNKAINYKFLIPALILGFSVVTYNIIIQKDTQIANTVIAAEKQGILTYEILAAKNKLSIDNEPSLTEKDVAELPNKINQLKQITPLAKDQLKLNGIAKDKNIIVIQAEAFQDFAINLKIEGKEVTPFLNQLVKESIYFPNTYQQIGPGNTSDAEFIFNTSVYPGAWEPTSETYGNREIPSFPKLLKEENYQTLTFHANDVSFWNRKDLYPALGFDKYYDIKFFGNEDVIGIGPSDDYVYKKAFPELKKLYDENKRFYAQFVTLSSHHPFKIPEGQQVIELPERFNGTLVGDYLKSLYYTDWALKEFVSVLKEAGMWEDTVLVFYGDHFGLQPSGFAPQDFTLLKELVGHDYTFLDQFNIPFIITLPGENISEVNETISGQVDMMPTVANILGLPLDNFVHFGQDIINYPNTLFGSRYYMPYGSFFNHEIAFKPAEGFEDGEAFDIHSQEPIEDYSQYEQDYDRIIELLKLSDDYLQSLPLR